MILTLTDASVGGTFLTWTIHYLSGQDQYFLARDNRWEVMPDNPVTDRNAHGFDASRPVSVDQCNDILANVLKISGYTYCQYFHPYKRLQFKDTLDTIDILTPNATKTIIVTLDPRYKLYYTRYSNRGSDRRSLCDPRIILKNDDAIHWDQIHYYHSEAKQAWGQENVMTVWGHREFLALTEFFKKDMYPDILSVVDLRKNHYRINSIDLWTMFEHNLESLFEYLEIEICVDRIPNWLKAYEQWKKIHVNQIMFCNYFQTIVDYVVRDVELDLTRFGLDIMQEAAIQHALMQQHNLKLNTQGLVKFTNTRHLHALLEPLSHDKKARRVLSLIKH